MRWKTRRLVSIAGTTPPRPGVVSTMAAAALATSVAFATASPASAWRSAGASLTPSPLMPTTAPRRWKARTSRNLVLRKDPGEDAAVERVAAEVAVELLGRAHVSGNAHLARHVAGGESVVARHHHRAHPGVADRAHHGPGVIAHRVLQAEQTGEAQRLLVADGHREHALAARGHGLGLCPPQGLHRTAQPGHHGRRPLHVAAGTGFLPVHRLGPLGGRVERLEGEPLAAALVPAVAGGRLHDRTVHRVLAGRIAGLRRGPQQVALGPARRRPQCAHGGLVAGERPRLVAAQHGHRGQVVQGAETGDQHASAGQLQRPQRGREREGRGQRDRDRGEQDREQEGQDLLERHPGVVGVAGHDHRHARVDHEQVPDHPHDLVLLPVGRARRADELRGLAEEGPRAGRE